jgi:hypothetical protein
MSVSQESVEHATNDERSFNYSPRGHAFVYFPPTNGDGNSGMIRLKDIHSFGYVVGADIASQPFPGCGEGTCPVRESCGNPITIPPSSVFNEFYLEAERGADTVFGARVPVPDLPKEAKNQKIVPPCRCDNTTHRIRATVWTYDPNEFGKASFIPSS